MADYLVDTDVFVDHLRGARRFELSALLAPFREIEVGRAIAERAGLFVGKRGFACQTP